MKQIDLLPIAAIVTMLMLMFVLLVIDMQYSRDANYTELFFSEENNHELKFNETTELTFTIANHELESITYNYVIMVDDMTVDSGFLNIEPDKSKQATVNYKIMRLDTPTKISVSLRKRDQEIHIWVIAK